MCKFYTSDKCFIWTFSFRTCIMNFNTTFHSDSYLCCNDWCLFLDWEGRWQFQFRNGIKNIIESITFTEVVQWQCPSMTFGHTSLRQHSSTQVLTTGPRINCCCYCFTWEHYIFVQKMFYPWSVLNYKKITDRIWDFLLDFSFKRKIEMYSTH